MSFPFLQPYFGLGSGLQTKNAAGGGGGGGGVGGWIELGRTALSLEGDYIDVSSLSNKRYYMILTDLRDGTGDHGSSFQFNSDTGSNYAARRNPNGAGDNTNINLTNGYLTDVRSTDNFNVAFITNYSTKEKLWINQNIGQSTAGAGTAPIREEGVGKWANTSNAINKISTYNWHTGNFGVNSEMVVLGWDPADTHSNNFWTELGTTTLSSASDTIDVVLSSAKKYLWIQWYVKPTGGNARGSLRMGNTSIDTGTNYSSRYSTDGGADTTLTSSSIGMHIPVATGGGAPTNPQFYNAFVINTSSKEKLGIIHCVGQGTSGAGNAPERYESVGKWANTTNQADRIQIYNDSAGDMNTGSFVKVWGSD